jgi:hypothetical protein
MKEWRRFSYNSNPQTTNNYQQGHQQHKDLYTAVQGRDSSVTDTRSKIRVDVGTIPPSDASFKGRSVQRTHCPRDASSKELFVRGHIVRKQIVIAFSVSPYVFYSTSTSSSPISLPHCFASIALLKLAFKTFNYRASQLRHNQNLLSK